MTLNTKFIFSTFAIRPAVREDIPEILALIKGLAEYEALADQAVATEELLDRWLFREGKAEVIIGEADGRPVGFALFFTSFSTFLGKPGIYLEDLFVRPSARGNGFGKRMLGHLARLVVERDYGRLEWACLDWNKPSIAFYLSLGAQPMNGWTTYRLVGDPLRDLAVATAEA